MRRPDDTAAELDAWSVRHREDPPQSFPGRDRPPDGAWGQTLDRIGGGRRRDAAAPGLRI